MADHLGARKDGEFKAVSTAPSINKTPMGNSVVPIPYPVSQDLSSSMGTVANVRFNGNPAYVLNRSTQPSCKGDEAGSAKGVKSGTVDGEVKPVKGSSTVRIGGKPVIREGDPCTLNGGNCPGIYTTQATPSAAIADGKPTASTNPPVAPETPEEHGWWHKASPWVHGTLGIASFVPGLSIATGAADAAIFAAEGNAVEAGLAAASMIPGGKVVTTAGKAVKGAVNLTKEASTVAKVAKGTHEAEEVAKAAKLAKEAEQAAKLKKAEEDAARLKKAEEEAAQAGSKPPGDGVKVKGKKAGPCDHLRQGNGKGPYRGGAHSKTSKPVNDGKDSHHMPADDASPLKRSEGPAIQMTPKDHAKTSSNGQMPGSIEYREMIADLIAEGKWREVMATEIRDVRRVAREAGTPTKYNEAMLEMLEYFKCLEKHGLLK